MNGNSLSVPKIESFPEQNGNNYLSSKRNSLFVPKLDNLYLSPERRNSLYLPKRNSLAVPKGFPEGRRASRLSIFLPEDFQEDYGYRVPESVAIEYVTSPNVTIKLYRRRYLILLIFILYSMSNSFQWIQYSIIQNIITEYYNTSVFWVNCTSVVYMVVFIIGIIPSTWLLEKINLRYCIILGTFLNCLGSWIKCMSASPDRFWVTMIGQTIVAMAQLFVLSTPPLLAALWFSDKEVSRATAFGVFGNQVGIAAGFFIPPLLVPSFGDEVNTTIVINLNTTNEITYLGKIGNAEDVGKGLEILFYGVAAFTSIIFILIVLLFKERPEYPPSAAQASAQIIQQSESYYHSLYTLVTDTNFLLLFFTYGLNAGVFYGLSTDLNQIVTSVYGNKANIVENAGYMGVIITLSGIVGSLVCGYLLDWTQLFKQITLGVYISTLVGMVLFASALFLDPMWPLFIVSGILGFFMTGYLPIGFELAAEICYPHPEGTFAGLLNTSAQIFGTIFTFGGSAIIEKIGHLPTNICFISVLLIGTVLTSLVKANYKRKQANNDINVTKTERETKEMKNVDNI